MRIRRHFAPFDPGGLLSPAERRAVGRWALAGLGAALLGYLLAYLVLFPAPLLPGHHEVPRVLGLTQAEAQAQLKEAALRAQEGGAEPHPSAPQGTVIWQDPPPGVVAPENADVTLVVSAGPPKIPVPDVAGFDGSLAERLLAAAALTVSRAESVQAPAPRGVVMQTRPPAGTTVTPGAAVELIVSRGQPTIAVPDLLGLAQGDARARLELEVLRLGTVTRRRTREAAPGTVVGQRPAAGTLAAAGTVVDIIVARSPE
jgi:serine/threonine-protein kinase